MRSVASDWAKASSLQSSHNRHSLKFMPGIIRQEVYGYFSSVVLSLVFGAIGDSTVGLKFPLAS
jgi:hypothetical protein